jgi:hypothetical protein
MDHERAAADRGAVDPFRRQAEVVRDRRRRLAGGYGFDLGQSRLAFRLLLTICYKFAD